MYLHNKLRILVAVVLLSSICAFTPSGINQHSPSLDYRGSIAEPSKFTSYQKYKTARNIQLNAVSPTANLALISSSIAILSGYHINLFNKERNSSTKTWRQYQADTREDWSRHVRETEGWLYAIQSMRNAMVAQQFLATTVLSLLTLITGKMWDILRVATTQWERRLLTVQIVSISMPMLFSSYQFLQGVRLMTHAGFMFPVKNDTRVDNVSFIAVIVHYFLGSFVLHNS